MIQEYKESPVQEYGNKIQYLVDYMYKHGMLEEGSFTFPDGDTWEATTERRLVD